MEKNLTIDSLNIRYSESGNENGYPVLIMHGWGCNINTVASIHKLLESGMHVFSIDLPGHGGSDEPPCIWGVEQYTQLVEKFIDKVIGSTPALIGHSFGGRIAILLSSRRDIQKIVLVDAAGIKPKRSLNYYRKVYTFKAMKHILRFFLGKEKTEVILDKQRKKKGSADYAAASPVMRGILSKCVNEDLKSVMPKIKASALLVWGENDTATPLSDAKTMEKLIPDAGLVSFAGCGHYSFLDNPVGFSAVLKEFFKNELK
jgi:pimeloyl-ACP methyl ester carboxylesterase